MEGLVVIVAKTPITTRFRPASTGVARGAFRGRPPEVLYLLKDMTHMAGAPWDIVVQHYGGVTYGSAPAQGDVYVPPVDIAELGRSLQEGIR